MYECSSINNFNCKLIYKDQIDLLFLHNIQRNIYKYINENWKTVITIL